LLLQNGLGRRDVAGIRVSIAGVAHAAAGSLAGVHAVVQERLVFGLSAWVCLLGVRFTVQQAHSCTEKNFNFGHKLSEKKK
jgi:hypothetical protein